jgi:type IV secretory pathway VirD2 relaxase
VRPGRIRDGGRASKPKTFVSQVMRAATRAGYTGRGFGRPFRGGSGSQFGRGRSAALALSLRSPSRRVVIMTRVVRHRGARFRSAPLARHLTYLKRDGITRDGSEARMFDGRSDDVDAKVFADRCESDRHHFRFTISPEDAAEMADLRGFTRELMADGEKDLGTTLDWIAVDHWNTVNPHIHVLVRGRASDGKDLVISRDYISRGLRARAAERVTLELGPRSEHEIKSAFEREVEAERWTNLDRANRSRADEGSGIVDLRPGVADQDPELWRLMAGRVAKLARLGLAEQVAQGQWTLKPGIETTLRDLSIRGDIIKTMHRAMTSTGRETDVASFALHDDQLHNRVLGRLLERGLRDELKGSAYAVIDGIDGRVHHLRFADLELTSDARIEAIVEARSYEDAEGHKRLSLAVRSDFSLEEQVRAPGATWLDRLLLTKDHSFGNAGFALEVREAMRQRIDHLVTEGLARRQGLRVIFASNLLETLRRNELDCQVEKITTDIGLPHCPSKEGDQVAGIFRQRVVLTSGRFAMIDDGLGFQLVPWRPELEQHLGNYVSGTIGPGGNVGWSRSRKRGPSL